MNSIQHMLLLLLVWLLIVFSGSIFITHKTINESRTVVEQVNERLYVSSLRQSSFDNMKLQDVASHHRKEIDCLARNMYFESRGENVNGQHAVAFVTINRVRSQRYPDNICEVVHQARYDSNGRIIPNRCQFSWVCDGTNTNRINQRVYSNIRRDAEYIYINYYLNNNMVDTTNGSTHFHARRVNPHWSNHNNYQQVNTIGEHVFYRPTY